MDGERHCFGDCRGGGNILDFVAKMEKTDIRSAAVKIQEWFNIEPKSPQEDPVKDTKQTELVKEKKEPSPEERKNLNFSGRFLRLYENMASRL